MTENVLEFGPCRRARFLARPNRFVVHCRLPDGEEARAFLPNPGRLWELLLPEAVVHLRDGGRRSSQNAGRKYRYTAVAVEREGAPVLLHTHWTNQVARILLEQKRIPGLEDVSILRAEVAHGRSRFDFLLRRRRTDLFLEVKSCTLFGNRVAMFPDAVTDRGRRHLLELAELSRRRVRPVVLFLVHTSDVDWFLPDYHTDLAFSQTLLQVRKKLDVIAVSLRWRSDLTLAPEVRRLHIPWSMLKREARDRGSYLLLLRLDREHRLRVGRLGQLSFPAGFYLYVGSAMQNLSARLARHQRKRKKFHWHIDHLREAAAACIPLAIRSSTRDECSLAAALSEICAAGPRGFGASDCACPTHLFFSEQNPLQLRPFHDLLQRFRMKPPEP
ncbi:MAG: DNA/RNA nuclease SfsA [Planctomycetes bacterium]|nr:DNA/RNA nuclease SfsA [Planctomycetota bacterium]